MATRDGRVTGCDRCAAPHGEELCSRATKALTTNTVHGSYNADRRRTCIVFPGLNRAVQVSDGNPSARTSALELTLQLELLSVPSRGQVGVLRIKEVPEFSGLNLRAHSRSAEARFQLSFGEGEQGFQLEVHPERRLAEHTFAAEIAVSREPVTHPDQFTRRATITLEGAVPDQVRRMIDPTSSVIGRDPLSFKIEVPVSSGMRFHDED